MFACVFPHFNCAQVARVKNISPRVTSGSPKNDPIQFGFHRNCRSNFGLGFEPSQPYRPLEGYTGDPVHLNSFLPLICWKKYFKVRYLLNRFLHGNLNISMCVLYNIWVLKMSLLFISCLPSQFLMFE